MSTCYILSMPEQCAAGVQSGSNQWQVSIKLLQRQSAHNPYPDSMQSAYNPMYNQYRSNRDRNLAERDF